MEKHLGVTSGQPSPEKPKVKLKGRAFYEKIGSPQMILAPMVEQSEFAWRMLTRSFMDPEDSRGLLAYSPMFHARLFNETISYREHHFEPIRPGLRDMPDSEAPASKTYLDGHPDMDRPLIVQFCANQPDELLSAARYVEPFCDAVDLNLGCPQGIARKGHYGAFLQEDWDLIAKLISNLDRNLSIPVTAKIRILETKEKTLEYAKTILAAGASILTVHGRQRDQKGHNTGLADWSVIRFLRENLPPETVIFANGNILRHDDIARCLEATGADGVMSAEGNLHDPTIFAAPPSESSENNEIYWRGNDGRGGYRIDGVFRRYLSIIYKHVLELPEPDRPPLFVPKNKTSDALGEGSQGGSSNIQEGFLVVDHPNPGSQSETEQPPAKRQKRSKPGRAPASPNLSAMQAHLFRLLRPLVAVHTNVRDALAHSKGGNMPAFEHVLSLTERAVREGLLDYESNPEKYDNVEGGSPQSKANAEDGAIDDRESSLKAVKECKRPWWVCQPYVRPLPHEAIQKGSMQLGKKELARLEREGKVTALDVSEKTQNESRSRAMTDGVKTEDVATQALVCG